MASLGPRLTECVRPSRLIFVQWGLDVFHHPPVHDARTRTRAHTHTHAYKSQEGRSLGDVGSKGNISVPLRSLQVDEETWISEVCGQDVSGRDSFTAYEVKGRYSSPSMGRDELILLSVQPKTGRRHQIRVHFASMGRPLVGDLTYGRQSETFVPQCPRLFLHCAEVRFSALFGAFHARVELPQELKQLLESLRQGENSTACSATRKARQQASDVVLLEEGFG